MVVDLSNIPESRTIGDKGSKKSGERCLADGEAGLAKPFSPTSVPEDKFTFRGGGSSDMSPQPLVVRLLFEEAL